MTEEIASTPGWVEQRLDAIFSDLPPSAGAARDAYSACLARRKAPAAPSDMLGSEFDGCRGKLRHGLAALGLPTEILRELDRKLEALEAEIAEDT